MMPDNVKWEECIANKEALNSKISLVWKLVGVFTVLSGLGWATLTTRASNGELEKCKVKVQAITENFGRHLQPSDDRSV